MELLEVKALTSPNIYSLDQNIVLMRVKLGKLVDTPTRDIPEFNDKIINFFPGLIDHKCTKGYIGGFVDRLKEGTYLAHVTEHLCLEVQKMLGCDVRYGKARNEQNDVYRIIFACENILLGKACANFIYRIINNLVNNLEVDFAEEFATLHHFAAAHDLGVSTGAIFAEARRRGIPASEVADSGLIRLGYGKYQRYISATLFENTSSIAADIACDKALTKALLREVAVPVPNGAVCLSVQEAVKCAHDLRYPVVVKPKSGNKGKYVSVNIRNEEELSKAFAEAKKFGPEVIVEEYIPGKDYRVLVVNGKVTAVAERKPPQVKGDGRHTVLELINLENLNTLRGDDHEKPLTKIRIDDQVLPNLARRGFDLDSIPAPGETIILRANSNLSTGGTARDCTDVIHPCNKKLAELAVKTIGLDIAGVDFVIPDIARPMSKGFGAVVEVNAAPGIRMHLQPSSGQKRDVVSPILDMIYPPGRKFTIPIISITGTNGKTTTTRMINHILKNSGYIVGMTTTHGIYVNGACLEEGDTTGYRSSQRILNNRQIDVAVLETARGGIIKSGLAYQRADIALFTNLSGDHLGIDQINNMEDLFHVKSLVTEAVKPEGFCILNADDPWTLKAKEKAGGRVLLFSMDKTNPELQKHIEAGGQAVFVEKGSIYMIRSGELHYVIDIANIPATLGGLLKHNIYNSLAAVAACHAMGIPLLSINKWLRSFSCEPCINPGRFNIYELNDFKVILDYGHNYDGYRVTIDGLKGMGPARLTGIIGVPGDRRNEDIFQVGKLAGKTFDQLIIKEDKDLRERQPLEVANILKAGALASKVKQERILFIPDEEKALAYALQNAQKGEVICVFFEKMEPLIKVIQQFKQKEQDHANESGFDTIQKAAISGG